MRGTDASRARVPMPGQSRRRGVTHGFLTMCCCSAGITRAERTRADGRPSARGLQAVTATVTRTGPSHSERKDTEGGKARLC